MNMNTLSSGRDLTADPFWAGIFGQAAGEPLDDADAFEPGEAAHRLQCQFIPNISHEIRAPLSSVIDTLELLAGTELTRQQQRYVRAARVSADSLFNLVSDALEFSEIEPGAPEPERTEFNSRPSVDEKTPGTYPLDVASLLDRCWGDTTFCTMILQKFAARAADQLSALDRAAGSRNAVELARQAHTLRGIAASLSADELGVCAARLERQAQAGGLDQLGPLMEQMHAEVASCLQAMPEILARISWQR